MVCKVIRARPGVYLSSSLRPGEAAGSVVVRHTFFLALICDQATGMALERDAQAVKQRRPMAASKTCVQTRESIECTTILL